MNSEVSSDSSAHFLEETALHFNQVRVGGVSLQFASVDRAAIAFPPPLDLFRVEACAPDIAIQVDWRPELSMPPARQLFHSGYTWRLYDAGPEFRFDFHAPACGTLPYRRLLIDRQFSQARLHMSEKAFEGVEGTASPLEYPLDELLIIHRLTQEKAIELHSCGIVRADGTGNLFVGHSGAGKSTTTRLWTAREDVVVLSDDRIIVRRDRDEVRRDEVRDAGANVGTPVDAAGSAGRPGVPSAGSGQALRLRDRSASSTGNSAQDDKTRTMRMYGTPWHGEGMYTSPGSAPLARIFILEHGHGNVVTRLSPSQAVAELFARSFVPFHRHEYVDSALQFLQELVGEVPCYRYAFEPTEAAVERIQEFRD
jgi:hypothetical protein